MDFINFNSFYYENRVFKMSVVVSEFDQFEDADEENVDLNTRTKGIIKKDFERNENGFDEDNGDFEYDEEDDEDEEFYEEDLADVYITSIRGPNSQSNNKSNNIQQTKSKSFQV